MYVFFEIIAHNYYCGARWYVSRYMCAQRMWLEAVYDTLVLCVVKKLNHISFQSNVFLAGSVICVTTCVTKCMSVVESVAV